jgi:hypothetical protein
MHGKTTVIAALVLVALGAYIYFFEGEEHFFTGEPASETESEREEVFDLEVDEVHEIEIRRKEGETLELAKDGDSWRIQKPIQADADSTEVETLLSNITGLERTRVVHEGADNTEGDEVNLSDFGLEEPELEVLFKVGEESESSGFLMGDETPTGTNRYAKLVANDKVFLVSSYSKNNFEKEAWDLRDKNVLHFESGDVQKVTLTGPEGEVVLAKSGEDQWNVTTPSFCRADRYKVSSLVSRFETAKMEEIVSVSTDDLDEYGLSQPTYELDLELDGGRSVKLSVGNENDGRFYARDEARPEVFLVASNLVDDIKKDASEYRSKRLFDYATYQVKKFQIAPSDQPTRVYEKQEEGDDGQAIWTETAPESREWDRTKVEDLLYKINGTDAEDFVEVQPLALAELSLEVPAFVITVWSKDEMVEEELAVGAAQGEWVYARRKGDEPALKVKATAWDEIVALMDFGKEDEPEEEEK